MAIIPRIIIVMSLSYYACASICSSSILTTYTSTLMNINGTCIIKNETTTTEYIPKISTYNIHTKNYNLTQLDNLHVGLYVKSITGYTRINNIIYERINAPTLLEYRNPHVGNTRLYFLSIAQNTNFIIHVDNYDYYQLNSTKNILYPAEIKTKPLDWIPWYISSYNMFYNLVNMSTCVKHNETCEYIWCAQYPSLQGSSPFGTTLNYEINFPLYGNNYANYECKKCNGLCRFYSVLEPCNGYKIITEDGYIIINNVIIYAQND